MPPKRNRDGHAGRRRHTVQPSHKKVYPDWRICQRRFTTRLGSARPKSAQSFHRSPCSFSRFVIGNSRHDPSPLHALFAVRTTPIDPQPPQPVALTPVGDAAAGTLDPLADGIGGGGHRFTPQIGQNLHVIAGRLALSGFFPIHSTANSGPSISTRPDVKFSDIAADSLIPLSTSFSLACSKHLHFAMFSSSNSRRGGYRLGWAVCRAAGLLLGYWLASKNALANPAGVLARSFRHELLILLVASRRPGGRWSGYGSGSTGHFVGGVNLPHRYVCLV